MHCSAHKDCTLLELLKSSFPDSSTTSLKKWLAQERIEVNGSVVRSPIFALKEGDEVELLKKQAPSKEPFEIIYEDPSFVVIDKPNGLLSVALDTQAEISLHTLLKRRYPKKRVGVVHRLDRDTSGAIAFALNQEAYLSLKEQLKTRAMKRRYLLLVEGILDGEGVWDSYLKEDASLNVHTVPPGTPGGERAITQWYALGHDQKSTLLECHLVTGRKNQIRVHAQASGHPVVGDAKYGSTRTGSRQRLMLHAAALECRHPTSGQTMRFDAKVPESFMKVLSNGLRKHALAGFLREAKR